MFAGGPAFSAYASGGQSIPNATITKVQANTEEFDTASAFDNVTNYRFTPQVAGYYQVNGQVQFSGSASQVIASIYKNGAEFKRGAQSGSAAISGQSAVATALVYLNGTTDYVEFWVHQNSGGALSLTASAVYNYFQGFLARAA
jgi:hypothetical protein